MLDRDPGDTGALELTVFERDDFKSIDASVNWLNDNIIVADRLDVANLVRETAATARADLLATDAADAASAARRDFLRDAARTRERFMKDLDAVISSINRCTFDVLQRAHLAIDGMKGLDDDMDSLADIRERSKGIASVSDLLNGIDGVTTALRDRVSALERDVGEALRQAEAQSEDEQRRVEAFIQSLEARRAELRGRLRADGCIGGAAAALAESEADVYSISKSRAPAGAHDLQNRGGPPGDCRTQEVSVRARGLVAAARRHARRVAERDRRTAAPASRRQARRSQPIASNGGRPVLRLHPTVLRLRLECWWLTLKLGARGIGRGPRA